MLMHPLLVAVPGFEAPTEGYAGLQGLITEFIHSASWRSHRMALRRLYTVGKVGS